MPKPTLPTAIAAACIAAGFATPPHGIAQGLLDRAAERLSDAADAIEETVEAQTTAATGAEIDAEVDAALAALYAEAPETRDLHARSVAALVFPTITKGGFIVGGEYGEGAMRENGATTGYYSIAGVSYGLQIGGQQFSYAMFFLNEDALRHFRDNKGWEAGVGPTLVGGRQGWSRSMGTNDLQGDIAAVFFGQAGLMAGGGLQGTKITEIDR